MQGREMNIVKGWLLSV